MKDFKVAERGRVVAGFRARAVDRTPVPGEDRAGACHDRPSHRAGYEHT